MIATSALGRIWLFGEHQDYLHLPVIAAAINLRIHIEGKPVSAREIRSELPGIPGALYISLQSNYDKNYSRFDTSVIKYEGKTPVYFLKAELKEIRLLNPISEAIPSIVIFVYSPVEIPRIASFILNSFI